MTRELRISAATTLAGCAVMAAIGWSEPKASYREPGLTVYQRVVRMMHDRNLTKNATDEEIAGYYEGLLAAKPTNLLGRARDTVGYHQRGDFRVYEARPNLDLLDYDDPNLRFVTNSYGLPDAEYPVARQAATRRLAILGDSVTRGQGAPFGESFEALLEAHLNGRHTTPAITSFELMNFSNTGYRLTQIVDVALDTVPRFAPDVYVVCLSRLAVSRKWGDHVAQLVYQGIDLKYPYLRDLAAAAALDPRDPPGTMDAKLAPHRLPAIRWAMETIQAHAKRQGATVVAVFVPTANGPDDLEPHFAGVEQELRTLGIPVVNLLRAFEGVGDLSGYMVGQGNVHPNRAGHRRIFEMLAHQLGDAATAQALLGRDPLQGAGGQP